MKPFLSVIVPAYNEEKNFHAGLLGPMVKFLNQQKYSVEVIFVNDGSTDKTKSLLENYVKKNSSTEKKYRLLTIDHGGKAAAVRSGILASSGEIVLFTDFDQSTPIENITNFISAHKKGSEVVIGMRGGNKKTEDDTLIRKIRSQAFVLLVRIIAIPNIKDSQCGFKSFKQDAAKRIFSNLKITFGQKVSGGYMGAFDVEALFIANRLGYKISQLPVTWIKIPGDRLNIWREPIKMAIDTVKVRLAGLSGRYNNI